MHWKTVHSLAFGIALSALLTVAPGAWSQGLGDLADADGDGILDAEDDACLASILTPTVVIDSCDSLVPNTVFPNGCSLADRIAACAVDVKNHGKYVSCVSRLTNSLK